MTNTIRISMLTALALTFTACATDQATGANGEQGAIVFHDNSESSQELAEDLTYSAIDIDPTILGNVEELDTIRVNIDQMGNAYTHLQQFHNGVRVLGAEAIVRLNNDGTLQSVTQDFKKDITVDTTPLFDLVEAVDFAVEQHRGWANVTDDPEGELVIFGHEGKDTLAYRVQIRDLVDTDKPSMPVIFIDAKTGEELYRYDNIQTWATSDSDQVVYDMNNGTNYNSASVGDSSDSDILSTYNGMTETLAFLATQGRDSYNGSGAVVNTYQHYSSNYVNAFWDGSKLTFGDGDGSVSNNLGVLDVAAHELGHAVTTYTANLTYANESGALNEASSDILAAAVEEYVDGSIGQDTWDIGEDCWLDGRALRFMQSPSTDGSSRDHYSSRYTGSADNGGVHWNSGIANHFFYLLTVGGQHHSQPSGTNVSGIGIDAAYDIWYHALANNMNASTNFAGARTATESSCASLYGSSHSNCASVSDAWAEVGVGSSSGGGGSTGGTLTNGVAETGISGSASGWVHYTLAVPAGATSLNFAMSGGTGDGDMYVKFGSTPTTSSYDCRPYASGNNESCPISSAQTGTYYVSIRGYSAFSGVSLTGSYTASSGGGGGSCTGESLSGSLTSGATAYEPSTGSTYLGYKYKYYTGGVSADLDGPSSADFDLYLHKWSGSAWDQVDSSTSASSTESVSNSATGYYGVRVLSYSGSGSYDLCLD